MASGWAGDGAVQDQIDSTIDDAVARARRELPRGESNKFCDECGEPIPEAPSTGHPRGQILREVPAGERFT
ncbi:Zinc-finger containing protein [Klebsiella pneumoniae subsp. ozaenae]|uniref:Zinc-finger containing protein n=1 Tax=Klebsiella pneumoniae subsp. ozaenae TaxID=574 RepID=A0A378BQP9_KLEPO|nr:Zinc-finger containing protein [Klebsiella pneumoniae subsp. ozaenae]